MKGRFGFVWILATLFVANGALGLFILCQTLLHPAASVTLPSLAGRSGTEIAYFCIGVGFLSFLVSGLMLFAGQRQAIYFYVAGIIGYAAYVTIALLVSLFHVIARSVYDGGSSAADMVYFLILFCVGFILPFLVLRAIYFYLKDAF